jgi:hypothetical protein
MKEIHVAQVRETGKQITVDFEGGTIVEGLLENGTHNIQLQNGATHVITVKDGRLLEVA